MGALGRFFLALLATVMVGAVAGCGAGPAADDKISARDDLGFELWISARKSSLSADDIRELNEARQNLRYKQMQAFPGMSAELRSAAVYAEIEGKTRRELLLLSYALQVERVQVELANYRPMLKQFKDYGDPQLLGEESRTRVIEGLARIQRLMAERQEKLGRLRKRIGELRASSGATD
jgi:hypothetical protein